MAKHKTDNVKKTTVSIGCRHETLNNQVVRVNLSFVGFPFTI